MVFSSEYLYQIVQKIVLLTAVNTDTEKGTQIHETLYQFIFI